MLVPKDIVTLLPATRTQDSIGHGRILPIPHRNYEARFRTGEIRFLMGLKKKGGGGVLQVTLTKTPINRQGSWETSGNKKAKHNNS